MHPIGLCGLGNMGLAVLKRLASSHQVIAYDLSPERRQLAARVENVRIVDSLQDFADLETIVLSLPLPKISHQVCTELTTILKPGSLVIETSTTTPADVLGCADVLSKAGVSIVDSAILSGVSQMESGSATLLVGGSDEDLDAASSVFNALGANVQRFGPAGSGMAAKVINNAVAHAVMVVLAEATSMTVAAGIDVEKVTNLLQAPDGGLIRPLTHRIMERVASGNYAGGMPLDAARKDSILAMDMAQSFQVPLFAIRGAHTVYDIALGKGLGRLDYSALATLWEDWTKQSLSYKGDVDS